MNTSFAISLANSSGRFVNGIRYRIAGSGDDLEVTAYTNLRSNNEEITYTVSMKDAKAENWVKNPKYRSLPELMLRYRAATFLIRTHAPEVMNGMYMIEELEDVRAAKEALSTNKTEVLTAKLDDIIDKSLEVDENITDNVATISNHSKLLEMIANYDVPQSLTEKWCKAAKVDTIEELDESKTQSCIEHIAANYANIDNSELRGQ